METDEKLIRRGELILDPSLLESHEQELKTMNKHKEGPHYRIANSHIEFLAAVRYLYQMPYRQLEGFTRSLNRLVPALPPADYSGIRKRILSLPVDPYRSLRDSAEAVTIAVDSTGIKVHKAGGWVERKHGKKSRYVKLHFAVRVDTHDVKALPSLVEGSMRSVRVARVIGDGAYDSGRAIDSLEERGIGVVVKPRRNSRGDTRSPGRGAGCGAG